MVAPIPLLVEVTRRTLGSDLGKVAYRRR